MNANGFPVLYTSNDGNTYDQSPFGGGGGVVNVLSDNPAYSQFVQQQSQGNTATVSSSSYPSAALVSANSLHNYAVDFNGRGGGVPRMPYTTATLGRPRHVGVGLQASDPSICAQVSLRWEIIYHFQTEFVKRGPLNRVLTDRLGQWPRKSSSSAS